ncbi:craniofacial development protein 2-like [Aphis craccivora]|uniref:Craniofacial development protein 2-like n=1 Tax=Aphis craccivora TaxID=307492 RepID=A0A6G0YUW1_APHCR|nr:craniofacial development protein 2-like [Aphis craccivora]
MIGHVLRHKGVLYIIIEGKINGKRDRGRPRTSYIKRMISDVNLAKKKKIIEPKDRWQYKNNL